MKNLVIVESPTKARTIGRYLGGDFEIKASMGHVLDLPKSKLGVDVDHNFKPDLEMIPDKEKIVAELKKLSKSSESVVLATDPDREGEAIASDLKEVLKLDSKTKRIVFHEITKEAIEEAIKNPRSIDKNLVEAQTARRILDRLVGYKLSPMLWKKVRRGLSAGRVQSIALRLIVEREREIEKFKSEVYFTIKAVFIKEKTPTEFELIEINNEKIETQEVFSLYDGEYRTTKTVITTEDKAKKILEDIKNKIFFVADVVRKETRRTPNSPFTTSTLQQDASRRFGFFGKRTMRIAQKLYEEGLITYHRTDSTNLSVSAINSMRNLIKKEFGGKFIPETPRIYKVKQKLAQEAHEAIRPTKIKPLSDVRKEVISAAGNDGWKLFELIWRRAIASQMTDAIIESTTVFADSEKNGANYRFKANGSVLVFEGFLKINPQALQDNKLPDFNVSDKLNLTEVVSDKHETLPPPRYNDASIIKTLEEKGIGRPSTYASIISTIQDRRYIEREEGKFIPTPVGVAVNDFLVANFPDIDDIPFTAKMEDDLDEIANGKQEWQPMISEFYKPFSKKLEKVEEAKRVKIEVEKTDQKCPKCGAPLVIRTGRFGKFFSCSKFPECDFTKSFVEETNIKCPKCGGKVIVKRTRKGRKFYGCSNYPKCDFAAWKLEDIKKD